MAFFSPEHLDVVLSEQLELILGSGSKRYRDIDQQALSKKAEIIEKRSL